MATKESIASQALILLGTRPIDSFEEDSDLARTVSNLYPDLRDALMNEYPWRFLTKKAQLGRLTAVPLNEWQFIYQLPSDIMGSTFALFESLDEGAQPVKAWEQFGSTIYTNFELVAIDYRARRDEAEWPGYFTQLMTYECAWIFAQPATSDDEKMDRWFRVARGASDQGGKGGYFNIATTADAQGSASQAFQDFDLIAARFG